MDVFTNASASPSLMTIADNGGDDDIPSLVDGVQSGRPAAVERLVIRVQRRVREWAAKFTDDGVPVEWKGVESTIEQAEETVHSEHSDKPGDIQETQNGLLATREGDEDNQFPSLDALVA